MKACATQTMTGAGPTLQACSPAPYARSSFRPDPDTRPEQEPESRFCGHESRADLIIIAARQEGPWPVVRRGSRATEPH